jgi:hypothetical protein
VPRGSRNPRHDENPEASATAPACSTHLLEHAQTVSVADASTAD